MPGAFVVQSNGRNCCIQFGALLGRFDLSCTLLVHRRSTCTKMHGDIRSAFPTKTVEQTEVEIPACQHATDFPAEEEHMLPRNSCVHISNEPIPETFSLKRKFPPTGEVMACLLPYWGRCTPLSLTRTSSGQVEELSKYACSRIMSDGFLANIGA